MRLYPKAGITRQERTLEEGFERWTGQDRWGIFREHPGMYRALRWRQSHVHRHERVRAHTNTQWGQRVLVSAQLKPGRVRRVQSKS